MDDPQPVKKRKTEHQASMTSSGVNSRSSQTGALQKLPQELKDMIHGHVLSDFVEDGGYIKGLFAAEERTVMLLWAFGDAFRSPEDKKDYLAANNVTGTRPQWPIASVRPKHSRTTKLRPTADRQAG